MRRLVMPFLALAAVLPSPAYAHHSHPLVYDPCKSVTIEGRIDSVVFKDPHTEVVLKLDDGTLYTVDWAGASGLTRQSLIDQAKQALVYGARVAVTGNRIRPGTELRRYFPDFKGETNPNTLDAMSIRRADDSFRWAAQGSLKCNGQ